MERGAAIKISKPLVFIAVALSLVGHVSEAFPHRPGIVYVQSDVRRYPLLRPFFINKTSDQMARESAASHKHFDSLIERVPNNAMDLLEFTTPVKDQGNRGTCVAFASNALLELQIKKLTHRNVNLSEQYIYWESKVIAHIEPFSDGSEPLDLLHGIMQGAGIAGDPSRGVPRATAWRYEPDPWYMDEKGHPDCYRAYTTDEYRVPTLCLTNGNPPNSAMQAQKYTVDKVENVPTSPESLIGFIESGIPVEIGVDVYDKAWGFCKGCRRQFTAGKILMPTPDEKPDGGHALLVIGFNRSQGVYLFKNSWGVTDWGSKSPIPGFGTIPMSMFGPMRPPPSPTFISTDFFPSMHRHRGFRGGPDLQPSNFASA